ncbi:spore maturation protein B [Candidatus Gastranaerophilus sp. (ex Termes propinquus)]|nr:spore maturation protein B [Candidatus Gastranaerophilus sp. (ex Termes propinquus)]
MKEFLSTISLFIIPLIVCVVLLFALYKRTPAYENFVDGAKEGFWVAVKILPYLVAIIVAVSMFRASGAIEMLQGALSGVLEYLKIPSESLVLMITRSLSGSATLGIFSDIVNTTGADSYAAKLCAVIVGSSETTFYVLAVYFGAVGIKKVRHALLTGVLADVVGIVLAVGVCRYFF